MKLFTCLSHGIILLAGLASPVRGQSFAPPFFEQEKLTAPAAATSESTVAVSGDVAIVANQVLESVQIYRSVGTSWALEQTLTPSDWTEPLNFGQSVSISGDVALVGVGAELGSAYVFRFNGTTWDEEQKLNASGASALWASSDHFVSVSGDVALVGDEKNDGSTGAAYVFRFNGTSWIEEQKLTGAGFGSAVAISGDVAVIGVFIFRFNGASWDEEQILTASSATASSSFGRSVAISGEVAIVGDRGDDHAGNNSGVAYVYRFNGTSWDEQMLTASDPNADYSFYGAGDQFGASVSISGDVALVGATLDIDPVHLPPPGTQAWYRGYGSAYLFRFDGSSWYEAQKITSSEAAVSRGFAQSLSVSGNVAFVGGAFLWGVEGVGTYETYAFVVDCNANGVSDDWEISSGTSLDLDANGLPDECEEQGACCTGTLCDPDLTPPACTASGGVWLGVDICLVDSCAGTVTNFAASDYATAHGSVTDGWYLDTYTQDDVHEALQEERTGGTPANRRSRLQHTWTINVAPGTGYAFFVDAHHTPYGEDDFVFSYSLDDSVYTDMLTVRKTRDDDARQLYTFPEDIAGLVFVRVNDDDFTPGNSLQDTLFVDEMFIVTSALPDEVPPAAPTGLVAAAGDGLVSLDWADNSEPDLAGYDVHRATSSGGPYAQVNGAPVTNSDHVDTGLTNGTTYYYVVSALDTSENESGNSNEAQATPQPGLAGLSVASIVVDTVNVGQGRKRGRATVTIVDEMGVPVANADVTGTFSGDLSGTYTSTTNAAGIAVLLTTDTQKGGVAIQFCVDDVVHTTLPYDPVANVETCDVN